MTLMTPVSRVMASILALLIFQIAATEAAQRDLYISAAKAIQRTAQDDTWLLVDVRKPSAFALVNIPDSLNMPLFALKAKPFLRGRQVILVHDGFPDRALETSARDLIRRGFQVKVLRGGLAAWQLHGGRLRGDAFIIERHRRISPERFHREMEHPGLMIVDLSDADKERPAALASASVRLAITTGQRGERLQVEPDVLRRKHIQAVLVIGETGDEYDTVSRVIEPAIQEPVFYLEGGMAAYRNYAAGLADAGQSPDGRLVRISECKPCREADNTNKQ